MIGVWMTPCKNGQCELSVRRDGINKIVIATQTPLTDAQAEELFWCIGAMQKSGKTLKDLLKEKEAVEPYMDFDGHDVWRCGKCGATIFHIYHNASDEDAKNYAKFCRHCGREVKWDV
jgi:ribosomal protein S27AE